MIRSELKKIVQMQHDTVMSFLNGGQQQQTPSHQFTLPKFNNLDHQLTSLLKQQSNQPVEFIIETKIKTIDPVTGQTTTSAPSAFALNSHLNKSDSSQAHTDNAKQNYFLKSFTRDSSLINMPLLNLNQGLSQTTPTPTPTPPNLPLLGFKSVKIKEKSAPPLLALGSNIPEKDLNRHVRNYIHENQKQAITNYRNFPLLKLNYHEGETIYKQLETLPPQPMQHIIEPLPRFVCV